MFLQCPEQKVCPSSTPFHSTQNFLSNESLFAQIGLRTRELRPFYFGDEICPEISERATLNVFSITPCTGLQICWFLMCWNGNLMELLKISHFLHLYTSEQALKLMKITASITGFGEVDDLSSNSFRHDFFFNYLSLVYMVSENQAFSRHVLFLRSLA
jgi:hypothetical protein